jgi:hypothetical protein
MLEIGPSATGHHRAGQDVVDLHAIGDPAVENAFASATTVALIAPAAAYGAFGNKAGLPDFRTTAPLAIFSAGHAAIVRRRAPCSLSARPASYCASVISNRSICGTAPAMLTNASMRPNAARA